MGEGNCFSAWRATGVAGSAFERAYGLWAEGVGGLYAEGSAVDGL